MMHPNTERAFMDALRATDKEAWRLTAGDWGNVVLLALIGISLFVMLTIVEG